MAPPVGSFRATVKKLDASFVGSNQ